MIRYEIITADGRTDRVFIVRDGRFGDAAYMEMYEYLTRRFDLTHEQADNAASWCEIATVGEAYEEDEFEIEVTEED